MASPGWFTRQAGQAGRPVVVPVADASGCPAVAVLGRSSSSTTDEVRSNKLQDPDLGLVVGLLPILLCCKVDPSGMICTSGHYAFPARNDPPPGMILDRRPDDSVYTVRRHFSNVMCSCCCVHAPPIFNLQALSKAWRPPKITPLPNASEGELILPGEVGPL